MTRPERTTLIRWLEHALWIAGVLLIASFTWTHLEAALYQRAENRALDALLDEGRVRAARQRQAAPAAAARRKPVPASGLVGRLEIPRLEVSTIVRAGDDAKTLRLAVGWIPGTALPGELGTVGLAGHRDTFFRRLADIRAGDEIRLVTPGATYEYRVEATDIVKPSDVWVLDNEGRPLVALVTCYPFTYTGPAPRRFIVRAAQVGTGPAL